MFHCRDGECFVVGQMRVCAAFWSLLWTEGKRPGHGSPALAVPILASPAEHLGSFLRRANVGAQGAEDRPAGGPRGEDNPSWHR